MDENRRHIGAGPRQLETRRFKTFSKLMLALPPWPVVALCGFIVVFGSYRFAWHTTDGEKSAKSIFIAIVLRWIRGMSKNEAKEHFLTHREHYGTIGRWMVAVVVNVMIFALFGIGYRFQQILRRLANRPNQLVWARVLVRMFFGSLLPALSGFLGANVIVTVDSYFPILMITAALFIALLVCDLGETFPAVDAVAALDVALAVKLPNAKGEMSRLMLCLIPGCLKAIYPELIEHWINWVRVPDEDEGGDVDVEAGNQNQGVGDPVEAVVQAALNLQEANILDEWRQRLDRRERGLNAQERVDRRKKQKLNLLGQRTGQKLVFKRRQMVMVMVNTTTQKAVLKGRKEKLKAWKVHMEQELQERRQGLDRLKEELEAKERRLLKWEQKQEEMCCWWTCCKEKRKVLNADVLQFALLVLGIDTAYLPEF